MKAVFVLLSHRQDNVTTTLSGLWFVMWTQNNSQGHQDNTSDDFKVKATFIRLSVTNVMNESFLVAPCLQLSKYNRQAPLTSNGMNRRSEVILKVFRRSGYPDLEPPLHSKVNCDLRERARESEVCHHMYPKIP